MFASISEALPIYGQRRRPYVMLCCVGVAVTYVLTAQCAFTMDTLLFITFLRTFFAAFWELMLGATLVDMVRSSKGNLSVTASSAQSTAMATRMGMAPLLAVILGFPLYPCDSNNNNNNNYHEGEGGGGGKSNDGGV